MTPSLVRQTRNSLPILLLVLVFFSGFALFSVLRHEMWRDEIQAWATALASGSVSDLYRNLRYTGHGSLWYLLLYALSRATTQPLAMQILHVLIATASAALILFALPLPRLHRILIAFGYFPLYEYAVISRDYSLGLLLTLAFCTVAKARPGAYTAQALILFILSQTTVYGVFLAVSLALYAGVELMSRARSQRITHPEITTACVGLAVFIAGIGLALLQLVPPPDSGFAGWYLRLDHRHLIDVMGALWEGFFPLPRLSTHFWNTNVLDPVPLLKALLGLCLLVFSLLMHGRRPGAVIILLVASMALLLFSYTKIPGYLRHHGHYWVVFLAATWLWTTSSERPPQPAALRWMISACERHRTNFVLTVAVFGVAAGLYANTSDWFRPFSASVRVARFIRERFSPETPVVGDMDFIAEAVSAHLNRPFFYPMGQRTGTFIVQDKARLRPVTPAMIAGEVDRIRYQTRRDVLLLLSYEAVGPLRAFEEVRRFPAGIVSDERYFLYRARQIR